jgi:hypothetical protein
METPPCTSRETNHDVNMFWLGPFDRSCGTSGLRIEGTGQCCFIQMATLRFGSKHGSLRSGSGSGFDSGALLSWFRGEVIGCCEMVFLPVVRRLNLEDACVHFTAICKLSKSSTSCTSPKLYICSAAKCTLGSSGRTVFL